jgi:hypothetical protein
MFLSYFLFNIIIRILVLSADVKITSCSMYLLEIGFTFMKTARLNSKSLCTQVLNVFPNYSYNLFIDSFKLFRVKILFLLISHKLNTHSPYSWSIKIYQQYTLPLTNNHCPINDWYTFRATQHH